MATASCEVNSGALTLTRRDSAGRTSVFSEDTEEEVEEGERELAGADDGTVEEAETVALSLVLLSFVSLSFVRLSLVAHIPHFHPDGL